MKKSLIVAAALAVIGGSALAYTAYAHPSGWNPMRWRHSASDMTAFADARIAALKAGLTLTPEQEKLWPPVETAMRELAKKRIDRMQQFRAARENRSGPADPIARLRRGADRLTETGADLKRLADASQPLYDKLDDAQKRRLTVLTRRGMRGHGMHRGMGWRQGALGERDQAMRGHDGGMDRRGPRLDDGEARHGPAHGGDRL